MEYKLLTASTNTGIGLWTSICVGFSAIFGVQSLAFKKKQNRILYAANRDLLNQFKELGSGYSLHDYRVFWSSKLSVSVSAMAIKDQPVIEQEETPTEKVKQESLVEEAGSNATLEVESTAQVPTLKEEAKSPIMKELEKTKGDRIGKMRSFYEYIDESGNKRRINMYEKVRILEESPDHRTFDVEYYLEGKPVEVNKVPSIYIKIE